MISFPNCKINLGLNITGKRSDGYHNLETVFYTIPIRDALEVIQAADFNFSTSGLPISGNAADNLCIKAYHLLKADFPDLPNVNIHLHKKIPMGAGLGGGSADGAFMLKLLNKKFHLNISEDKLTEYALQLGSDCPFFIINKPCFATGRGELMETIKLDLSSYQFVIINPGIHISTKEAFSNLHPTTPEKSIKQIIDQPVKTWKEELLNDFEQNIFTLYPTIKAIKDQLYAAGAVYASMTGTGSTVYGIFGSDDVLNFSFPKEYISVILPKSSL